MKSAGTEDDTFRVLSRAPYPEVRRLYDDLYRTGEWVTIAEENRLFESLGWTYRDFMNSKRIDNDWH
jgi:hypothetical protein